MISLKGIDYVKEFADEIADLIPGGISFGIVDSDTITWIKSSDSFNSLNIEALDVGNKLDENSTTINAIKSKKVLTRSIDRSVYGVKLEVTSIPIINDDGESVGAFVIVLPKIHPLLKSFDYFAPILSEMFPEGAFLAITDLTKIIQVQPSTKFDIPSLEEGTQLPENSFVKEVIKTGVPKELEESDSSKYGVPVSIISEPIPDEGSDKIMGTMTVITPKKAATNLRNMSENLSQGLTGISSAIQELAASAANINTNEQDLNNEIKEVISISEQINSISQFIKDIADETKMLGLNAAIEAARAGEYGRGFGVVAEEIRKLSDQSKSTVPKIIELTNSIKEKIESSSKKSQSSLSSSQEQAAATEEITASIEEINKMADDLTKIAQDL